MKTTLKYLMRASESENYMRFTEDEFFSVFEPAFESLAGVIQSPLRRCEYLQRYYAMKSNGTWLPPVDILGIFEAWKYLKSREKHC